MSPRPGEVWLADLAPAALLSQISAALKKIEASSIWLDRSLLNFQSPPGGGGYLYPPKPDVAVPAPAVQRWSKTRTVER
jgi:hypothetical protein